MVSVKVNPAVESLEAYVPGEQLNDPQIIKLNTNESPYPAAPEVLEAVREAVEQGDFQKYPNPVSKDLRETIARDLGVEANQVMVGNGSDEVLRLVCHAFLDPAKGDSIGMLYPTYVLYRTLAEMFGASCREFDADDRNAAGVDEAIAAGVKVFFLPNPNPPLGLLYSKDIVERFLGARPERLVVIDEAYVDFAGSTALDLLKKHENLLISRTFSKSYSLAGLRVGFAVAHPDVILQLDKIRDSYNLNRLSQAAALAAWNAKDYYRDRANRIRADRAFVREELVKRGFDVPVSEGNFVFARRKDARELYEKLKERKILVRYFNARMLQDGIRITIGTREQMEALLGALDNLAQNTQ